VKIEISKVFCSVVAITMAWVVAGRILLATTETSPSETSIIILLGAVASWLWYYLTMFRKEN